MPDDDQERTEAGDEKGFADSVQMSEAFSVASRHYLAPQQLWTALHNARLCEELEAELLRDHEVFHIQHRAYAVTSVLTAVAFLESLVNELFQDALDIGDSPGSRARPLDSHSVARLSQFWPSGERYISLLEKYQMALLLCDRPRLDPMPCSVS